MKKHITQGAIEDCAALAARLTNQARNASTEALAEYYYGEAHGVIAAFAILTGQNEPAAMRMLAKRARTLA